MGRRAGDDRGCSYCEWRRVTQAALALKNSMHGTVQLCTPGQGKRTQPRATRARRREPQQCALHAFQTSSAKILPPNTTKHTAQRDKQRVCVRVRDCASTNKMLDAPESRRSHRWPSCPVSSICTVTLCADPQIYHASQCEPLDAVNSQPITTPLFPRRGSALSLAPFPARSAS